MNKDQQAIELLRKLLHVAVSNTKLNYNGKPANDGKEHRAVSNVLQGLLRRAPTQAEIDLAQKY